MPPGTRAAAVQRIVLFLGHPYQKRPLMSPICLYLVSARRTQLVEGRSDGWYDEYQAISDLNQKIPMNQHGQSSLLNERLVQGKTRRTAQDDLKGGERAIMSTMS